MLKGFDQTVNMILAGSHERVYSSGAGVEVVQLGLYIIRGDNMYVHNGGIVSILYMYIVRIKLDIYLYNFPYFSNCIRVLRISLVLEVSSLLALIFIFRQRRVLDFM